MAAPVDAARVTSTTTTGGASHTINVGSPAAGTLLIVLVRFTGPCGTVTFTGYTVLLGPDVADASASNNFIYYRWADGSEGVSDAMTTTLGPKLAAITWGITGAEDPSVSPPQVSTVAIGTTTANTADPSSVAPAGAPRDTLYIAMMTMDGETNTPTASPTNYSAITVANSGTGGATSTNGFAAGGSRQIAASSSEDPGAFTHPAAISGWSAYVVAIRDATSAAAGPASMRRQRRANRYLTNR